MQNTLSVRYGEDLSLAWRLARVPFTLTPCCSDTDAKSWCLSASICTLSLKIEQSNHSCVTADEYCS